MPVLGDRMSRSVQPGCGFVSARVSAGARFAPGVLAGTRAWRGRGDRMSRSVQPGVRIRECAGFSGCAGCTFNRCPGWNARVEGPG